MLFHFLVVLFFIVLQISFSSSFFNHLSLFFIQRSQANLLARIFHRHVFPVLPSFPVSRYPSLSTKIKIKFLLSFVCDSPLLYLSSSPVTSLSLSFPFSNFLSILRRLSNSFPKKFKISSGDLLLPLLFSH